jgi:hypothetical protein
MNRSPSYGRWSSMCHEQWMRRGRRREERFDQELRYLIDVERARKKPRAPVLNRDQEPRDPERVRIAAGTRS